MGAADEGEGFAAAQVHTLATGRAAALLRDVATELSEQAATRLAREVGAV